MTAILHSRWVAHSTNAGTILGQWAEDNQEYHITVPHQLRSEILRLQNFMYEKYQEIKQLKYELENTKNELDLMNLHYNFQEVDIL